MTEYPGDLGVGGSSDKDVDEQPVMDLEAPKLSRWEEPLMASGEERRFGRR